MLTRRADAVVSMHEDFGYDSLNRMLTSQVTLSTGPLSAKAYVYSATGNILSKSGVGDYTYPAAGQPRPHGVTSVTNGGVTTTYTYDAKGNMVGSSGGLAIAYTSYNKTSVITRGATTLLFDHDPELQRYKQANAAAATTTYYLVASGAPAERETTSSGLSCLHAAASR